MEQDQKNQALAEFVLRELEDERNQDDVIASICLQSGWHWQDAKKFLEQVQVNYQPQLRAKQNNLVFLASIIMILDGIVNVIIGFSWIFGPAFFNPRLLSSKPPTDGVIVATVMSYLIRAQIINSFFLGLILTGIGMIAGGIIWIGVSIWRGLKSPLT
ncbi:MAG: hypothetical protein HY868_14265 [Chloroflexi bacterium]|nr:hypothetical protein [Chloroflexota bacterium]